MTDFPFDDRGLAYGDGVFETVLVRQGRPVLWAEHKARLATGCQRLGFAPPVEASLDRLCESLPQEGVHVLKIIVTRGSGGRGYLPPNTPTPRLAAQVRPFSPNTAYADHGVTVRLCHLQLAEQPCLAGIKHLNRLENVLARQEWQDARYAEGLLCDAAGRVVEATAMNVFWFAQGQWYTPGTERCGVYGTLTDALIRLGHIRIAELQREMLPAVSALCVGNSVQGIWPVTALHNADGEPLAEYSIIPCIRALQRAAAQHMM